MSIVKPNDKFEIQIELRSGEIVIIEGRAMPRYKGTSTLIGECTSLYSSDEAERKGMKLEDIPWIEVPFSDLECELSGGFVTIRRGKEIIFMEMRDRIKKSVTLVNGEVLGQ